MPLYFDYTSFENKAKNKSKYSEYIADKTEKNDMRKTNKTRPFANIKKS